MFSHRPSAAASSTAHRVRLVLAAAYTGVVLAVSAVVLAAVLFSDDPGFIGVWLIVVTAPLSVLGLLLTEPLGDLPGALDLAVFFAVTTGAGLVQARLLWPGGRRRRAGSAKVAGQG